MLQWLLALFGLKKGKPADDPRPAAAAAPTSRPAGAPPAAAGGGGTQPAAEAPPERVDFLAKLVAERQPADLQLLAPDDRLFLSGILKRIRENQLSIPLLPRAALEISRLLGNRNTHVDEFVRVLESDPALSVEVLRIANSVFYGFSSPTQSVHQAVVRIGLAQIRGLIIVAHLHGRVLQGGAFQAEAGQVSRLSMALARLGQEFSSALGLDGDAAFTRGVLSHAEHFIIMGTVAEVSKEHHRRIAPTEGGLLEAVLRFGPRVRKLAAAAWGLTDLMKSGDPLPDGGDAYSQLARALVAHWAGEPVTVTVAGVDAARLGTALKRLGAPGTAHGDMARATPG